MIYRKAVKVKPSDKLIPDNNCEYVSIRVKPDICVASYPKAFAPDMYPGKYLYRLILVKIKAYLFKSAPLFGRIIAEMRVYIAVELILGNCEFPAGEGSLEYCTEQGIVCPGHCISALIYIIRSKGYADAGEADKDSKYAGKGYKKDPEPPGASFQHIITPYIVISIQRP